MIMCGDPSIHSPPGYGGWWPPHQAHTGSGYLHSPGLVGDPESAFIVHFLDIT